MKEIESLLKDSGVTPTPVRMLVARSLRDSVSPLSLSDIEAILESVDKSTISRTLAIFREHHIVHSFNDGSGSVKYELCWSYGQDEDNDRHVHFHCEHCGKTLCLSTLKIPEVKLPAGFHINSINYVISGICPDCFQ